MKKMYSFLLFQILKRFSSTELKYILRQIICHFFFQPPWFVRLKHSLYPVYYNKMESISLQMKTLGAFPKKNSGYVTVYYILTH